MKINQWTLGLAAVGVVSLASAVNAEEAKMNALQTALSATTISGYIDTSVEWNDNDYVPGVIPMRDSDKQDGFNLNVIKLSLEKALDESEWASGYKVDLLFGPDANWLANGSQNSGDVGFENADFAIKQAYVALRTPIGNGIDWKVGYFDTIIGYETFESGNNPNFTRSWGYAIEPTQHTGILGTYRVNDMIAIAAGAANTETATINTRDNNSWDRTWLGSIAITAPDDAGFLAGSTLYGGVILGSELDQDNYYVGGTVNTPVAGLKAGIAYDNVRDVGGANGVDAWSIAGYLSFQASEKLSLHGRAEYAKADAGSVINGNFLPINAKVTSLTGTVQYDLWANVISRVEVRWDDVDLGVAGDEDTVGIYANLIYKF